MPVTHGNERFFASTRGRVVSRLRRGRRTVEELAVELDLTDNAIRAHLAALERDGLVRQGELRRGGVGKPAFTYELTPNAEWLFPRAYGLLLQQLLDVLTERLPDEVVTEALREVGRRGAAGGRARRARGARARVPWEDGRSGRGRGDPGRICHPGLQLPPGGGGRRPS